MRRIKNTKSPSKKVLFLGYDETQTKLINALVDRNCLVDHTKEKINSIIDYDFVVSYGYRHIIKSDLINSTESPIFNLHISYLPFNRGAHPNFWSFYENTPAGVTIHLIDEGVDTGPIVSQKYVNFKKQDDTFAKTYKILNIEIENLFIACLNSFLEGTWSSEKQKGLGTHHYVKDLPLNFSGWNANIEEEIKKLKFEGLKYER